MNIGDVKTSFLKDGGTVLIHQTKIIGNIQISEKITTTIVLNEEEITQAYKLMKGKI